MSGDQGKLNELLDTALDLPAEERERWLDKLPDEHSALKPRLKALLARAARIETSDFLQTLPKIGAEAVSGTGDIIGPYRLIRQIGAGGMGSVWLAEREDGALRRAVALKFLRAAAPNDAIAERLQRERDILAALVHPSIARLYDAGVSSDGLPYLALEYIEGEHIDQFCRSRDLDVRSRVALVLQVAHAVTYAHGKLVVHRDLKPTNVLVSTDGQAHLLDFGIAKLLDDGRAVETQLTQMGGRVLTPEYASPEQILGQPITTASDVYSLGVILYELLTDTRPYTLKRESRGALEDAIVEEEAQRPSERLGRSPRARALRGDLDAIVLKALKKAPDERYRTMDAFAEDLARYLEGRPVLARPDSAWYRLRRFAARNRLAVGAAGVVLLAIVAGAGTAIWQARIAIAERARAEEANQLMASIFTDADPYGEAGKTLTAVELLDQAHKRIRASQAATPEQRLELLTLVAFTLNNFQEVERAEAIMSAAIAEAAQVLPERHPKLLHARVVLALTHRYVGEPSRLEAELDALLPVLHESADADPTDLPSAMESAVVLALNQGRNDDSERLARDAIDVASRRFASDHPVVLSSQWLLVRSLHQQRKADAAYALAAQIMPKTLAAHGGDIRNPHVIEARELYGRVLARTGRVAEGVEVLADALQGARELFGPTSVAVCFFASNLANQRLQMRQLQAAQENVTESLQACAAAPGRESMPYAATQHIEASIALAARRPQAAVQSFTAAMEAFRRAGKGAEGRLLDARAEYALALAMTGDLTGARREIDGVVATQSVNGAKSAYTHISGAIEHRAGRYAQALALQQQAMQQITEGPAADYERVGVLVQLGLSQVEVGEAAAGETLQRALELAAKLGLHPDPVQADARAALERLGRAKRP
jgi:eukaryotic-like serine/threonine-protein kinase